MDTQNRPPDRTIDLTDQLCPMTFVRTRLALDTLAPGQTLAIMLRGEEPARRVPQTIVALGHTVMAQTSAEDGVTQVLVRKTGASQPTPPPES